MFCSVPFNFILLLFQAIIAHYNLSTLCISIFAIIMHMNIDTVVFKDFRDSLALCFVGCLTTPQTLRPGGVCATKPREKDRVDRVSPRELLVFDASSHSPDLSIHLAFGLYVVVGDSPETNFNVACFSGTRPAKLGSLNPGSVRETP